MFLFNRWYTAAWSSEVSQSLMARTLLNEPVLLYRKEDGTPVALEDRCCHKSVPLSMGNLVGDSVQCGYHGLVFDCTGECTKIPGQDVIPKQAKVRSFPVVERYGCLWIWFGDSDLVDESLIPNLHWLADDNLGKMEGYSHVDANYMLINENLLDLSHLAYLHSSTVGSDEMGEAADVKAELHDNSVRVTRWTIDVPAQPVYDFLGGGYRSNVDRWQISEFIPPAYHMVYNGSAVTGTGAPEGEEGEGRVDVRICHMATPETDKSAHYFYCMANELDGPLSDHKGREYYYDQVRTVIAEDLEILNAQQKTIDQFGAGATTICTKNDAGVVMARKMMERMIQSQTQGV